MGIVIPSSEEIRNAIAGAWQIIKFDETAPARFNLTLSGFWPSFFAAFVLAPPYLFMDLADNTQGDVNLLEEIVEYFLHWMVVPIVMIPIVKLLNRDMGYVPFIIISNWVSIPLFMFQIIVWIINSVGSQQLASMLFMILLTASLFYTFFIARLTLAINKPHAAAVTMIIFLAEILAIGAMWG